MNLRAKIWHFLTHVDRPMDMPFEVVEHYSTEQPMKKKTPKKTARKKTARKVPTKKSAARVKNPRADIVIDLDDACDILQHLACASDPIWVKGMECSYCGLQNPEVTETTPHGLSAEYPGEDEDVHRIEFIDKDGFRVEGTLRDMIIDRLK